MSQKKLPGQLREDSVLHTQMTFPGHKLHQVCAIHGAAGGVRTILHSQLLCPNYGRKTAAKEGSLPSRWPDLQPCIAVSLVGS